MHDQDKLHLEILKMEKSDGRHKKINSREKFSLYLIAFNFTINWYLYSNLKIFWLKIHSLLVFSLLSLRNLSLLNPHMTSINTFFLVEIYWLNNSSIFTSDFFSHVILTYDILRDILLFTLSIFLIKLVPLSSY